MTSKNIDFGALAHQIKTTFKKFDEKRQSQLKEIKVLQDKTFGNTNENISSWASDLDLPDLWEQHQTMKAHLIDIIYSHPEGLFDVEAEKFEDATSAIAHKAMLCDYFEKMNIREEIEKIVENLILTGESIIFVGWETKTEQKRKWSEFQGDFEIVNSLLYDGPKIKNVHSQDFVFDYNRADNWENCAKIYRTYLELSEIKAFREHKFLTPEIENELLEGVLSSKDGEEIEGFKSGLVELLEYWGDIRLEDGTLLKNWLIVVAKGEHVLRFEPNPYINTPFIYANLIENPETKRGISPLKPVLALNNVASKILNQQLDAYSLIMNPPYLAPKGSFKGIQDVAPGKIIEYDSSLLPQMPVPINFSPALAGWDFIQYFKNCIENTTGIYRTMGGAVGQKGHTATELLQSANGQNARINLIIDSINRKIILPMVKKIAQTISNFNSEEYYLEISGKDKKEKILIDEKIKTGNFKYKYSDRKASIERKYKYKEIAESIVSFSKIPEFSSKINWKECFKFTLSQLGVENVSKFLSDEGFEEITKQ